MKSNTVRGEILLRVIAIVLALIIIGTLKTANSQTMVTGETLGKGKIAGFVASNALVIKDFATLSLSMGQVWYGANNRVDVFAGASDTAVFGKHQAAAMFGGNINLLKSKAVSVCTFHAVSIPITRRSEGSPLWFASVVASKNIGKIVGYTGYSANVPLGDSKNKLFTPSDVVHNIPIGIAIPKGKWMWFVEYNFGKTVQTAGIGISFTP